MRETSIALERAALNSDPSLRVSQIGIGAYAGGVDLILVALSSLVHTVTFTLLGVAGALTLARIREPVRLATLLLFSFAFLQLGFYGISALLPANLPSELGHLLVAAGNFAAACGFAGYLHFWRRLLI